MDRSSQQVCAEKMNVRTELGDHQVNLRNLHQSQLKSLVPETTDLICRNYVLLMVMSAAMYRRVVRSRDLLPLFEGAGEGRLEGHLIH